MEPPIVRFDEGRVKENFRRNNLMTVREPLRCFFIVEKVWDNILVLFQALGI